MRHIAIGIALAAASAPAAADDFVPWPTAEVGLTFVGHGTKVGSQSESGAGANVELGIGLGRVQAFGEASLSSAAFDAWTHDAYDLNVVGKMTRAAVGARWLARQFVPDSSGAFELYLLATAGAERFDWDAGGTLTRPEFGLGWGFEGRVMQWHQFAFRLEARVIFTPTSHAAAARTVCRGTCSEPMPEGSLAGFLTSIGVSL